MQSEEAGRARTRLFLLVIVAVALGLRILVFDTFARGHSDELYQYFERAHQLVYDYGIVTWEQRYGIRNWIIPQLMAPPMALAAALSADPIAPVVAVRALVTASSLAIVMAAYGIGSVQSRAAGLLAALAVAIWPGVVGMGTHVLSENLAAIAVLCGCALAMRPLSGRLGGERAATVAAGLLLGIGFLFRFQSAIFSAVFVLALAQTDWRLWQRLLVGGVAALAIGAISDLAAGQTPFLWIWRNFYENVIVGRAARYGTHALLDYPWRLVAQSHGMMLVVAALALFSGPKLRPLLLACVADLVALSLIGHKEVRFVFLAATGLVIVGAVGASRIFETSPIAARLPRWLPAAMALLVAMIAYGSGGIAAQRGNSAISRLAYTAARDPQVCGIALSDQHFWHVAYAYLGRPVPIYAVSPFANHDRPEAIRAAANAYVANPVEPLARRLSPRRMPARRNRALLPVAPPRALRPGNGQTLRSSGDPQGSRSVGGRPRRSAQNRSNLPRASAPRAPDRPAPRLRPVHQPRGRPPWPPRQA